MIERMRPAASPPVARLLPRETLIALPFSSPLLVVFLSKNFLYGSWSLRIHTIVGLVFYAAVLTLALAVMFDGVLAQMPTRLRGHHVRLVLYWLAAMIVVVLESLPKTLLTVPPPMDIKLVSFIVANVIEPPLTVSKVESKLETDPTEQPLS